MSDLLAVRNLTVTFGAVTSVSDVTLSCERGALTGLIGPNGAGKTTLVDAVTGYVPSDGSLSFDGVDVTGWRPHKLAGLGLRRTWQSLELFDDITVRGNLEIYAERLGRRGLIREFVTGALHQPEVDLILASLGLDEIAHAYPPDLSHGRRKLVGVARALAGNPQLLLLDEPAGGLDRQETAWLGEQLLKLRDAGISILLVDHDMSLVMGICDHIHVLAAGALIASGSPAAVRQDADVLSAYLGASGASRH